MKVIVIDDNESSSSAAAVTASLALVYGYLEPYQISTSWTSYRDRLHLYFEANRIASDAQKRAIFLTSVGHETYEIVRTLVAPLSPRDVDLQEILMRLDKHFITTANEVVQRFNFYTRVQLDGETVTEYVSELRRLSENCNFTERDKTIRDQIVSGIVHNEALLEQFCLEPQLTLSRACELAIDAEKSLKNDDFTTISEPQLTSSRACELPIDAEKSLKNDVTTISDTPPSTEQVKQRQWSEKKPYSYCNRCAGEHNINNCTKSKNARCLYCNRKGHFQKACLHKKQSNTQIKSVDGTKQKIVYETPPLTPVQERDSNNDACRLEESK